MCQVGQPRAAKAERIGPQGQMRLNSPPAGPTMAAMSCSKPLVDAFNRRMTYLRLSVTDRCDLRCSYCMPEKMQFLPRKDVLSLEELHKLALAMIDRGISKIRLTGGEPLVRRDVIELVHALGRKLGDGLDELTLTTNGTQLAAVRRRPRRRRRQADQRLARHDGRRRCSSSSAAATGSARCCEGIAAAQRGGAQGQAQHRRAQGPQRGRDPVPRRMGPRARPRADADRGHAARRGRGRADRSLPAADGGDATRSTRAGR